jgi:hypothetical protein
MKNLPARTGTMPAGQSSTGAALAEGATSAASALFAADGPALAAPSGWLGPSERTARNAPIAAAAIATGIKYSSFFAPPLRAGRLGCRATATCTAGVSLKGCCPLGPEGAGALISVCTSADAIFSSVQKAAAFGYRCCGATASARWKTASTDFPIGAPS